MKMVALRMLKHYKGVNPGEIAGYPKNIAKILVNKGFGKLYDPKEVVEEAEDKSSPEAKVMLDVTDLIALKVDDIKETLDSKISNGRYLYNAGYISEVLDAESLGKGREGLMEYLMEEIDDREKSDG